MGGFFGITSRNECLGDVFFGADYHSHLGTKRAGMAAWNKEVGLQRKIHSIEHAPFRTKFEDIFQEMSGTSAIGVISDTDPQPLLIRSTHGCYAIAWVGVIQNAEELQEQYMSFSGGHFDAMTGGRVNSTELLAALIDQKSSFEEGIRFAQEKVVGSASIMILKEDGSILAARDRLGRLPICIGKREDGYGASFETFALEKLGFDVVKQVGPGEIVRLTPDDCTTLVEAGKEMKICAFLWTYYGYPTSEYEGIGVETMRYRNGRIMAQHDDASNHKQEIDYVGGVPDSGTPHAIGYANESGIPFARAFIKYTPTWSRSFMPTKQNERNKIAHMKQVPVRDLIEGKNLLFVDDSIVRGTQMRETIEFLYDNGAKSVHMRSACPPIMYGCKYLNFSRATSDMELIARQTIMELEGEEGFKHLDEYTDYSSERAKNMREAICKKLKLASLEYQSIEGIIEAIGLEPCKLCTYCWNGKE